MLTEIYNWFTKGFDITPNTELKGILAQISDAKIMHF